MKPCKLKVVIPFFAGKIKALSCQFPFELLPPGSLHFHPLYNSTSGKVSTGLSLTSLM